MNTLVTGLLIFIARIACRRRDLKRILAVVRKEDLDAFYITEMARDVSNTVRLPYFLLNGRRLVLKRK